MWTVCDVTGPGYFALVQSTGFSFLSINKPDFLVRITDSYGTGNYYQAEVKGSQVLVWPKLVPGLLSL